MRLDAVIVGGGPAGLAAAALLARGGASVAVQRRRARRPGRPGETLPGAGLRLLRMLDLPVPEPGGPHRSLSGISSCWDGRGLVETDYLRDPDGPAWLIDRPALEASLAAAAAAAGAAIIDGGDAPAPCRGGWSFRGDAGETRADFAIDATGRAAWLARRLGARPTQRGEMIALWSIADGTAPSRLQRPLIERTGQGWWFALRLADGRAYAALHTDRRSAAAARPPAAWTDRLRATNYLWPLAAQAGPFAPPRGAAAGGSRLARPTGPRWAACGDAAMAFDPVSSQGLLSALAGGHMLAEALLERGAGREAALVGYRERLARIWTIYADRRAALYAEPLG